MPLVGNPDRLSATTFHLQLVISCWHAVLLGQPAQGVDAGAIVGRVQREISRCDDTAGSDACELHRGHGAMIAPRPNEAEPIRRQDAEKESSGYRRWCGAVAMLAPR